MTTLIPSREEARLELASGICRIPRSAICAPLHSRRSLRNASLWEKLSASKFPFRHPVLHGSLFELRSFFHRILLLWRRGGTRSIEIGSVYQQQGAQQHLVRNKRTQARSRDIQKLLSDFPWLSGEDCHLFLMGWSAGSEWRSDSDSCTAESNGETPQDSFITASNSESVQSDPTSVRTAQP